MSFMPRLHESSSLRIAAGGEMGHEVGEVKRTNTNAKWFNSNLGTVLRQHTPLLVSMASPSDRPCESTGRYNCLKRGQDQVASSGSLTPPIFPLTTLLPKRRMPHTVKNSESSNVYKATWGDGKDNTLSNVVCSQPGRVTNGQLQQATTGTANSRSIQLRTNDARDDEIEENLTQVGSILGHWKNKALDMGSGVEATDPQIDWITEKAGINKDRIDFASARAKKFIAS
ncbi:synaptosomal-associated protein 23-like [Vulpes lagopus]|uniref:synaptosomal-associated protein 23-like n=1 Tax=Vulpes lagopus TaxID=494514 RepID=UPI001BC985E3|nr:synaptosomal-associated protein 23-like [Vulpes lagopus]